MAALVAAAFVVNAYGAATTAACWWRRPSRVLFVMNIFPLLWSLGLSFFAYQRNQQSHPLRRPRQLHQGPDQRLPRRTSGTRLHNTAMFVVLTVSAQMIVGFLLAMLFAKQFPLRRYLLILVLTPMMLSVVAVGVFFPYYYDPTFGLLSQVDQRLSPASQFILMDSKAGAVAGIVFADAWMWSPFVMLLVLAGLVSRAEISLRGGRDRPRLRLAALLDHHLPLYPRPPDAGAAVPHHRGLQAVRPASSCSPRAATTPMTIAYHLIRIANE